MNTTTFTADETAAAQALVTAKATAKATATALLPTGSLPPDALPEKIDTRRVKPRFDPEDDIPAAVLHGIAPEHVEYHRARGIRNDVLAARGIETFTAANVPFTGEDGFGGAIAHMRETGTGGFAIPLYAYRTPNVSSIHQLRLDTPRSVTTDGKARVMKFELPHGAKRGNGTGEIPLDFNPIQRDFDQQQDGQRGYRTPVVITEGHAKADAMISAALTEGLDLGITALTGVTMGYHAGTKESGGTKPPTLTEAVRDAGFGWYGRDVYLVWDADKDSNPMVMGALRTFGFLLQAEGASVWIVDVPVVDGDTKSGVDDALAAGVTTLEALLNAARPLSVIVSKEASDITRGIALADAMRATGHFRFNETRRSWMRYAEGTGLWATDNAAANRFAIEFLMAYGADTVSGSLRAIRAALEIAAQQADLIITEADLDADADLLCARNCVVDLLDTNGLSMPKWMPHSPGLLMTKSTTASYSPFPAQPREFLRFLDQTFGGDAETIEWLQIRMGSWLFGKVTEERLTNFVGAGRNGKTTLVETVVRILGSYGSMMNPDMLTGEGSHFALADLAGLRFVGFSETNAGERMNTRMLKQIAGRDMIRAERKYEHGFSFVPTHSPVLMTNHRMVVGDSSVGAWRRIELLPFKFVVSEADMNTDLPDLLALESDQILRWLAQGAAKYVSMGRKLDACTAVREATEDYRADEDRIGAFWRDCVVLDSATRTPQTEIYRCYVEWAASEGQRPMTAKSFWQGVTERNLIPLGDGVEKTRSKGVFIYSGLALNPVPAPSMDNFAAYRASTA